MRILFYLLAVFFIPTAIFAQSDSSFPFKLTRITSEYEKECGSRLEESQTYDEKLVKVIKIVSGNRILVKSGKGPRKEVVTVYLAGIAPNKNDLKLRQFLTAKILNKKITLVGNKEEDDDTEMFAIVRHKGFSELNRQLIESGMADYEKPDYFYSVSYVTMCIYRHELAKAKANKIGIWANTPKAKLRLLSVPAQDADNKPLFTIANHRTGCDPAMESQIYGYRTGKVIAVRKDNKLTILMVPDNTYTGEDKDPTKPYNAVVTLVGIDNSVNAEEINAFLRKHALGRTARVNGNARNARKTGLRALVTIDTDDEDIEELNEYLIEKGIAKFNYYKHSNIVPMCSYDDLEDAEIAAKKAKIGIWNDSPKK